MTPEEWAEAWFTPELNVDEEKRSHARLLRFYHELLTSEERKVYRAALRAYRASLNPPELTILLEDK